MAIRDNQIFKAVLLTAILGFLGFLVSQTVGLGAGGFDSESVLKQFNFYTIGAFYLVLIVMFLILTISITRRNKEYGDSVFYVSQGEYPSLSIFKKLSTLQITLLSFIIFLIFGIFALVTRQETFTGLKVLEHQFTPISSVLYSSLLIPISENAGSGALIALLSFSLIYFALKYNWNRASYRILALVLIPLIVGLYGYTNHLLRYSASEFNMGVVFVFWTIGGFMTVLSGSFIPFLIMHLTNNLIFDLKRFFDNDIVLITGFAIVIILSIVILILTAHRKDRRELI